MQTIHFAVETKEGKVATIGKGAILVPKTNYKGNGGIKWYEDKKTENK